MQLSTSLVGLPCDALARTSLANNSNYSCLEHTLLEISPVSSVVLADGPTVRVPTNMNIERHQLTVAYQKRIPNPTLAIMTLPLLRADQINQGGK